MGFFRLSFLHLHGRGRENLGGQLLQTSDDDRLLHIIAGVKRLLMKLKSREIYSGTWLQYSPVMTSSNPSVHLILETLHL